MTAKVLIIGPVNGRITDLVSKVSAIQSKHGPFSALFILGDLFHPSPSETLVVQQNDLLQAKFQLPIPTYFYQGSSPLSSDLAEKVAAAHKKAPKDVPQGLVHVTHNLYYAKGKSGVFVTKEGFRIAFVGGVWNAQKYAEANEADGKPFHPEEWFESEVQRTADESVAHINPATINRLLAHSSFRLPSYQSTALTLQSLNNGNPKPGSLAAARASASQASARDAAQTASVEQLNSRPPLDLLLTNCWPTGVTLFSISPNPTDTSGELPDATARMWGSPAIARLASGGCPRYHFSLAPTSADSGLPVGISPETLGVGAFWERAPYVNDLSVYLPNKLLADNPGERRMAERFKSVTRFVSLARFGNEKKKRWFLALNLTPADEQQKKGEMVVVPGNATQTPYSVPTQRNGAGDGSKRPAPHQGGPSGQMEDGPNYRFQEARTKRQRGEIGEDVPPRGYVCRICSTPGHFIRNCPDKAPPRSDQNTHSAASTGSNNVPLIQSSNVSEAEEQTSGWGRSTMPLPAGLPTKPTFHPHEQHHQQNHRRQQMIPVGPSNCWFCLSNPSVQKSLIVTIGAESYLAFPKGGFSDPSINRIPHNASHLLIAPLTHTSNLLPSTHPVLLGAPGHKLQPNSDAEEAERKRVIEEMEETKFNVRQLWREQAVRHVMLEWTLVRVRTSSRMTHVQTQILALLESVVKEKDLLKMLDDSLEALDVNRHSGGRDDKQKRGKIVLRGEQDILRYMEKGLDIQSQKRERKEHVDVDVEDDGYFHLVLHLDEASKKEWLLPLDIHSRFPVQWVRTTLAKLLNLPHLADWKTTTSQQEQQHQVEEEKEKQRSAGFRSMLMAATS
ncbi:uncharacterized protein MEPE_02958 [Melanopsichium pennsylvanicum]|uniref:CCHC-type domain-containing protein n=2 Tax=Melanopsichium pennsylvanicum TaxID=63383 RepID=A0AAJ4XLA1_9BASI|nr:conserved hypothetical protein [Melanopsichium pennsylvanicum 4]SNX84250.1 uncharacterized protein MEPE_02958 [Melanopsichium pennsylvanicum]